MRKGLVAGMSEGAVGLAILFSLAALLAATGVLRFGRPVLVALIAAPVSCIGLLAISTARLGFLDPFFLFALVAGSLYALPVALAVGWVAWWFRRSAP